MTVWIENYRGCSCLFVSACRRDLPGVCANHMTYASFSNPQDSYRGEVGYIEGDATE